VQALTFGAVVSPAAADSLGQLLCALPRIGLEHFDEPFWYRPSHESLSQLGYRLQSFSRTT
jgi:hypothetical protein